MNTTRILRLACWLFLAGITATLGQDINGTWHLNGFYNEATASAPVPAVSSLTGTATINTGAGTISFNTNLGNWTESDGFVQNGDTYQMVYYHQGGKPELLIAIRVIDDDTLAITTGEVWFDSQEALGLLDKTDGIAGVLTRNLIPLSAPIAWDHDAYDYKRIVLKETDSTNEIMGDGPGVRLQKDSGSSPGSVVTLQDNNTTADYVLWEIPEMYIDYIDEVPFSVWFRYRHVQTRSQVRAIQLDNGKVAVFQIYHQRARTESNDGLSGVSVFDGHRSVSEFEYGATIYVPKSIGELTFIIGSSAQILRNGQPIIPESGFKVYEGDSIITGEGTAVRIDLYDGSKMTVGPNSEMEIKEMVPGTSGLIDLLKGKIRSEIINSSEFRFFIGSRNSGFGVRGTIFEVEHSEHEGIATTTCVVESGLVDATDYVTGDVTPLAAGEEITFSSVIIVDEPMDAMVTWGDPVSLTVGVLAPSPTYQWYRGAEHDMSQPIDGATNSTLLIPFVTASDHYWALVSSGPYHGKSRLAHVVAGAAATGLLAVTIEPPEARVSGALWILDADEVERESGAIVSGLDPGEVTVSLTPVLGWITPEPMTVNIVVGEITQETATYVQQTYSVTFELAELGSRIGGGALSQTVTHGNAATAPTVAGNTGWTFTGWDVAFNNITSDLTVTAQYEVMTYTVTFDLDGNGTRTAGGALVQTIAHGEAATEPTVESNLGWTFTGWDVAFNNITSDLTVTAQYDVTTYTVTFNLDGKGTRTGGGELVQTIVHGEAATEPTVVGNVGWTFAGWEVAFNNVTANLTVTAQYDVTTYTVTFDLNGKGSRTGGGALSQTIAHGSGATAPTVESNIGWTFTGWDVAFSSITSGLTVTALYTEAPHLQVTPEEAFVTSGLVGGPFTPDSKVYTLRNIGHAALDWAASAGAAVTWAEATPAAGVLGPDETVEVTISLTAEASSELAEGQYTSTIDFWNTNNGAGNRWFVLSLHVGPVSPGNLAVHLAPAAAILAGAEWSIDDGTTWSGSGTTMSDLAPGDVTVSFKPLTGWVTPQPISVTIFGEETAQHTATYVQQTYTVTFDLDGKGTRTGGGALSQTIAHGSGATAPTLESNIGWTFTGWDVAFNDITSDLTVTALFTEAPHLQVTPEASFVTSGPVGGPFTPDSKVYTLRNIGHADLDWAASSGDAVTWAEATPAAGVLGPDETVEVTISLTAEASSELAEGQYTSTIDFWNTNNGAGNRWFALTLHVGPLSPGNLAVQLAPAAAILAGAEWSIDDGTTWNGSGTTMSDLAPGDVTVSFKPLTGWVTPQPISVTIVGEETAQHTATYVQQTYTVTFDLDGKGTRTGGGELVQTVTHGQAATAPTVAGATGWTFTGWDSSFDVVTEDLTVTAEYVVTTYTLTYSAGANGTLTGETPQTVEHGSDGTQVTAVANDGHYFVQWSDGIQATSRTDTNITANLNVTAIFAINTYTLTYSAGPNGSLTGEATQNVNHGSSGSAVTAVPDIGYHFVQWSDELTDNPRTDAAVTGDITVTASFALNSYTLTYSAGANGSLVGVTLQVVDHGASGTSVTAVPDDGHYFEEWSDGLTDNPRTDTDVMANLSVTAIFAKPQSHNLIYNLTIRGNRYGGGAGAPRNATGFLVFDVEGGQAVALLKWASGGEVIEFNGEGAMWYRADVGVASEYWFLTRTDMGASITSAVDDYSYLHLMGREHPAPVNIGSGTSARLPASLGGVWRAGEDTGSAALVELATLDARININLTRTANGTNRSYDELVPLLANMLGITMSAEAPAATVAEAPLQVNTTGTGLVCYRLAWTGLEAGDERVSHFAYGGYVILDIATGETRTLITWQDGAQKYYRLEESLDIHAFHYTVQVGSNSFAFLGDSDGQLFRHLHGQLKPVKIDGQTAQNIALTLSGNAWRHEAIDSASGIYSQSNLSLAAIFKTLELNQDNLSLDEAVQRVTVDLLGDHTPAP